MLFFPKPKLCICYWDRDTGTMPRARFTTDVPVAAAAITNTTMDYGSVTFTDVAEIAFNEKEELEELLPPTTLVFPDTASRILAQKTARDFEHDKKLAQKRTANQRRLARKRNNHGNLPIDDNDRSATCYYCRVASAPAVHLGRPNSMMYVKGSHVRVEDERDDVPDVHELETDWVADTQADAGIEGARPGTTEVPLAELVKPAKQRRRNRHLRHKASVLDDFELIPPVRAVVVLDEPALEPDADDPWECVDWDEDDPNGRHSSPPSPPTFAEILARNA